MSETQALLGKISALRQRLEQAPGRTKPITLPTVLAPTPPGPAERLQELERQVDYGGQHSRLLDYSLRQLTEADGTIEGEHVWPSRLTLRSRRLLERGRELVGQLRKLCDEPMLTQDDNDPLAARFRQTTAMIDTALRIIQAFPDAPSVQLRLGEGLEGIVDDVALRLAGLTAAIAQRRRDAGWIERLSDLLRALTTAERLDIKPFLFLAEEIVRDAQDGAPLRFLYGDAAQPARFVAGHGLVVAQVMSRLAPHDP